MRTAALRRPHANTSFPENQHRSGPARLGSRRGLRRVLGVAAALGAAAAIVVATPLAASAHVRVAPDTAQPGSYAVLTFRAPTESATASTTRLEVDFPTDTPFSSVSYQPVPDWSTTVTTTKLKTPVKTADATITEAVTKVVWTADDKDAQIKPGQFRQFTVTAGPVPDTGKVAFPAHQTYSDGSVVNWTQPTPASGEEPEHPAPVVYITDTPPADPAVTDADPSVTATPAPDAAGSGDTAASGTVSTADAVILGVGIGGLALGAIALAVALYGIAVLRRAGGR